MEVGEKRENSNEVLGDWTVTTPDGTVEHFKTKKELQDFMEQVRGDQP